MNRNRNILLIIFGSMLIASTACGYNMSGKLGVDLQTYTFSSSLKDTVRDFSSARSRSSHFLDLSLGGPVVKPAFASFLTRGSAYGIFYNSSTDLQSKGEYISPDLHSYIAQVTFFPSRPFPLKLYHSSADNNDLRYEEKNRSDLQRLQPELSVIRRYESSRDESGASLQLSPSNKINIMAEYKNESSQSNRIYDFGEDKDIWVKVVGVRSKPTDSVFSVVFKNSTTDIITIRSYNIDSLDNNDNPHTILIEDLAPGQDAIDSLYGGRNYFSFQSAAFNPLSGTIDVDEHLMMEVEYRDPAAPNDMDYQGTSYVSRVKLGDDGMFKNESYIEHSNKSEAIQKQSLISTNISNDFEFKPSNSFGVKMLTTITDSDTQIDTLDAQLAKGWLHQTSVGYSRPRSYSASGNHSISSTKSILGDNTLINDMQIFSGSFTYPSNRFKHRLNIKGDASFTSDNTGVGNDKYGTEINNLAVFKYHQIQFEPKHQVKLTSTKQTNPDKKSTGFDNKVSMSTKLPNSKMFGDIVIKTNYEYRKKSDDVGSDTKSKYVTDLSLRRKFENGYKFSAMTVQEWESTGGSAPLGGSQVSTETIHKSSYKIGIQGEVIEGLSVQSDFSLISSGSATIKKFGFSVMGDIPKLNIPIKSFLLQEYRDIDDIPRQSQLTLETKTNFRLRQVTFIFVHAYKFENQLDSDVSSHDLQIAIARSFDLF